MRKNEIIDIVGRERIKMRIILIKSMQCVSVTYCTVLFSAVLYCS